MFTLSSSLIKLKKGGRCSRALLSRFESFLYGLFMSPEERRTQERIICVEECLSSASAKPTANHNDLTLHRLRKVISHPDIYSLDEKDSRIAFLRNELLTAISAKSKLSRANCKKFVELLDPDGIVNAHLDNPGAEAETPTSTRKVPPKPASPRVPSSHTPEPPSQPTCKQNTAISLSPSPNHPPPFPSRSSSLSSLSTPSLKSIDLTGDTMFKATGANRKIRRPTVSRSSQSNNTAASPSMSSMSSDTPSASPATPSASKKRPAPGTQPDEISTLSSKCAASGRQLSTSDDVIASVPEPSSSGTQLSPPGHDNAPAPENAASGALLSNSNNDLVPLTGDASSGRQPITSDTPKQLWAIFLDKHGPLLPALDLNQLKIAFSMAVNHGELGPNVIDPTLGVCLAIACHLTPNRLLWQGRKWYDAAVSALKDEDNSTSLEQFYRLILRIEYVHMVGDVAMSWRLVSLAIADAEILQMHTMFGGRLAVDKRSQQQVRAIWQSLWTKKLFLALQFGGMNQSLDVYSYAPMPAQSQMEEMTESNSVAAFFIACSDLLSNADTLLTVEKDLRVTKPGCPFKALPNVDMSSFYELDASLLCWHNALPKTMQWRRATIEYIEQRDVVVRRLALVAYLRYHYFRLRQNRPFLVLAWRFSQACACGTTPHLTGKDMHSVNSPAFLTLVTYGAMKCVTAAQEIFKTLWVSHGKEKDGHAKCEQLDYLYATGLVLIAAMRMPCLVNVTQLGASRTTAVDKSMNKMNNEFLQINTLLRNYQADCEQAPQLKQRIQRCRDTLALIQLQSVSSDGIISDRDVTFPYNVWCSIYGRLSIDLPFERFSRGNPANGYVHGHWMIFGWLESLPFDLDSQGE